MRGVAAILGISFAACLILSGGNWVQVSAQKPVRAGALKFDEFGSVGHCDLTARLDNLTIQVQNTPRSKAYIVAYGPEASATVNLENIKYYLVHTRGLQPNRIGTIYGGRNNDLHQPKFELWIVPKGARPPEPEKYETNIDTFKGLFSDEEMPDDFGVYNEGEDVEGMGPGIAKTTLASFAEILQQQKDSIGYVVTYNGEDAAPGAWRRVAQNEIDALKKFNLDASRFKTMFGGRRKETRVQLWVVPKDAPAPVPEAGPELPPVKTIKIDDFYASHLATERNQIALLTRLTEILREQKSVRVFLVVRLAQPMPEEQIEDSEAPVASEPEPAPTEEPEEVDLTKLVEKWRVELAKKHNIGDDRFVTLSTQATDFQPNLLALWIVPRGQPLPDPNEEEQELENETPVIPTSQQAPAPGGKRTLENPEVLPQSLPAVVPITGKRP